MKSIILLLSIFIFSFQSSFSSSVQLADSLLRAGMALEREADLDKAIINYHQTLQIAKTLQNFELQVKALRLIAKGELARSNVKVALSYFTLELEVAKQSSDDMLLCMAHWDLGTLHDFLGDYSYSLENYLLSAEIAKRSNNNNMYPVILASIGAVYAENGGISKAIEFANKALTVLNESKDIYCNVSAREKIGETYRKVNKFEEAIKVYKSTLVECDTAFIANQRRRILWSIATSYLKLNKADEAKVIIDTLSKQNKAQKIPLFLAYYNILASQYFLQIKDYNRAIYFGIAAADFFKTTHSLKNIALAYEVVAKSYSQQMQNDSAYFYVNLRDSILNHSLAVAKKNLFLSLDNQHIVKEALENIEAKQKRTEFFLYIALLLIAVSIAIFVIYRFYKKYQRQQLLAERYEIAETLIDSKLKYDVFNIINNLNYYWHVESRFVPGKRYFELFDSLVKSLNDILVMNHHEEIKEEKQKETLNK